jgi:glycosyltransferase involved in cell wall biosynthesis
MIENSSFHLPKVTVVTVCYNSVNEIEDTIQSVVEQDYPNFEYLVIDGLSNDGTVEVIKKYERRITYWESTKDKGIYDAMNKGIMRATGDWILFMNSGDCFYDKNVLKTVFSLRIPENILVIYGNAIYEMDFGRYYAKPLPLEYISNQSVIFHQSCFIKLSYHRSHLFELKYRLAGDYNFFYQLYLRNKRAFLYVDKLISIYEATSGISTTNQTLSYVERNLIQGHPKSKVQIKLFDCKFKISRLINRLLSRRLYVIKSKKKLNPNYFIEIDEK